MRVALLSFSLWMACSTLALAQAGGPELKTNDPYYPGEGALSSPSRVLQHAFATPRGSLGATSNRDKLIRLFLWRGEHYSHLYGPAIYNLPGIVPDPLADHQLMSDFDAMRVMFSYGWGLCGHNHAQMRVFTDEAGWPSRRRNLSGDTGYEVQVDPGVPAGATGWRYCNTDQYTLHFLSNDPASHFASVDQVININHRYIEWNPDLGMGYRLPQANTHGNYQDFAGVTGTVPNRSLQWRDYYGKVWATTTPASYPMYGEGYTSTPVVVSLKRGETFTRWIDPQGAVTDLGLAGRVWWGYNFGNQGGGDNSPFIKHSFVQNAPARDQAGAVGANPEASSLVGQRYGNGCFHWMPGLANGEYLDGTAAVTGTISTGGSPALRSTGASKLVLFHNSPYTIAGRPSDGKDPAASSAAEGALISADTVGSIPVEVSTNAGATWSSTGTLSGAGAKLDFTNSVKGRNQYLLRLSFADGQGLNSISLRTVTMMSQAVYPNLKSGTTQVTYTASNTGALELSPDLWSATSANSTSGYVQKVADSGNLTGVFYSGSDWAYNSTNGNPISITYKITLPAQLAAAGATWKQIFGASNAFVKVTPEGNPYSKIEISPDQSAWTQISRYEPPTDNQLSGYWAYGRSADGTSLGGTSYYVRFTSYNGGFPSSFRFLRLSATYTLSASAAPVQVTYHWNNGASQNSSHTVAAGAASDTWTITTGATVAQQKVVLAVASGAAMSTAPTITTQPSTRTVTAGQTATFTVVASGSAPLSYQWQRNGTDIPGATGTSYTTPATTLADSGATFTVRVTNTIGSATSESATLTVTAAPAGGATSIVLQQGLNGYTGAMDTYLDKYSSAGGVPGGEVFGNQTWLEVRWYPSAGTVEDMLSLLRFDVSGIPQGATVTSASLTLHNIRASANTTGSSVITLGNVQSVWDLSWSWNTGVPTSAPTSVVCPTTVPYTLAPNPPEVYTISGLESLVQGWVNAPASNFGLMLSSTTNLNMRFCSSRFATAQYRPALNVTYTSGSGGTPPSVTVNSPPGTASSSPITVTGTASGTSAVAQVTWTNAATGESGTATGTGTWTATIPLAAGDNVITITATDASGTPGSSRFTVNFIESASPISAAGRKGDHESCGMGVVEAKPHRASLLALVIALLFAAGLGATCKRRGVL